MCQIMTKSHVSLVQNQAFQSSSTLLLAMAGFAVIGCPAQSRRQCETTGDVTCMTRQRNSTGHLSFQASMKANLIGFGLQRRLWPFLALPSPRAADGLRCEASCSPSQRLHAVLTSGHRANASEPPCSTATVQRPNPIKLAVALSHWWLRCALHHAETRLCISLPFFISFIANIARRRPELNRDNTINPCAGDIHPNFPSGAVGHNFFQHMTNDLDAVGELIIIGAGIYIWHRESRTKHRLATHAKITPK
jgi:hypothetical protein